MRQVLATAMIIHAASWLGCFVLFVTHITLRAFWKCQKVSCLVHHVPARSKYASQQNLAFQKGLPQLIPTLCSQLDHCAVQLARIPSDSVIVFNLMARASKAFHTNNWNIWWHLIQFSGLPGPAWNSARDWNVECLVRIQKCQESLHTWHGSVGLYALTLQPPVRFRLKMATLKRIDLTFVQTGRHSKMPTELRHVKIFQHSTFYDLDQSGPPLISNRIARRSNAI